MTTALANRLGVPNPAASDEWLIESTRIRLDGDLLVYGAEITRSRPIERLDFWRRLARERE